MKAAEEFWALVERGPGCWPWRGARGGRVPQGSEQYGYVTFRGVYQRAHRVAYELTAGPLLAGQRPLHSCDNPPCCRPDHLFAGSQSDNISDAHRKGRFPQAARGRARIAEMRRRRQGRWQLFPTIPLRSIRGGRVRIGQSQDSAPHTGDERTRTIPAS